jgi:hypothetical protein
VRCARDVPATHDRKKRVFQNEYMTGSSSSDPVFSNLTLSYFEDR